MSGAKNVVSFLNKCLQTFGSQGGLDNALMACKVVGGSPGQCTFSMVVDKAHANLGGTLHGGFSAHLVDSITTMALMTNEGGMPGVSVDMNLTYIKAAKIGEEILIEAKTLKKGRTLAFLECEIRNKESNALLVKGSHTKFIGS